MYYLYLKEKAFANECFSRKTVDLWVKEVRKASVHSILLLASPTHFPLALEKNVKQLCKLIISILNHTSHKKHTDPLKKSMERK